MARYFIDIVGSFTMQQLSDSVRTEENIGFSWYLDCRVTTDKTGDVVNHCEFEEDHNRPMPSVTALVGAGKAGGSGLTRFWTGKMLVQNAVTDVDAYR
ncbi:MAG: hypothetical protein AABZ53_12405 [Planctomycetota bacterium]